jgi:hypothetical protein
MRLRNFAIVLLVATISGETRAAEVDNQHHISGPVVSENLAIYFIHGPSSPGPAPLTLKEAMANDTVRVYETGNVNELAIENRDEEAVFVQAGDMVKGGKQDRALTVSLLLARHSDRFRSRLFASSRAAGRNAAVRMPIVFRAPTRRCRHARRRSR